MSREGQIKGSSNSQVTQILFKFSVQSLTLVDSKLVTEITILIITGNLTLLTRIGGIIGVGKEFLWIMITLLSFILTFKSTLLQLSKIG